MKPIRSENPPDPQPILAYMVPYTRQDDEIRLIDLWQVIAKRNWIIPLSFLISIALASAYLFFVESVYRAETHLRPPQKQDMQDLLIRYPDPENLGLELYTPEFIFNKFRKNIRSIGVRREFFDANNLATEYGADKSDNNINADRIFDMRFNKNLSTQIDEQDDSFLTVSLSGADAEQTAQRLNEFVAFVNEYTVRQLYRDVTISIQVEADSIKRQIASLLTLAEQSKRDKIIHLQESLRIAKSLGIEGLNTPSVTSDRSALRVDVNTAATPLYMRGARALEAEIAELKARESEEVFVDGLRELQHELASLESISINLDGLSAAAIDGVARVPYLAESPRKLLIFLLAAMVGILAAIFAAFIIEFLSKMRQESSKSLAPRE